ncbi:MAG: virginiamycin B lyase family protein [bacterium]
MRTGALLALLMAAFLGSILPGRAQEPRGQQVNLPDGAGKEIVQTTCARCHGLNLITNSSGYTREGWEHLFSSMLTLPRDQAGVTADYLAKNFPVKPDAVKPVIIPGPVTVNFKEWLAPSLGSRPHDPLAARDGSVWWSGQYAMKLGRVDPRTGAIKEFPVGKATPHGLVEDREGNIWYTGINIQVIGKLNPRTGEVTEYPMPIPEARGPHTPIFDQKGMLWFTLQSGHVGRVNPATGEVKISKSPTDNTYPYGIQVNSKGVPWYVDFRGPRVASVDPVTMQITEYPLPNAEARPRRIAITPDDAIWYTDYPRGYIGRFDPATKQVKEWPTPSGPRSQPYGIAAVGNVLWYNESAPRPNTLVRFDSRTEQFQTFTIPAGGVVVRHMMATPTGNLVLAESGINRVALVEVGGSSGRTQ